MQKPFIITMDALGIFAIIAGLIGIIGSIVPGIPGPPISWVGLLLVYFTHGSGSGEPMSTAFLFIWLAVTIIVTVLDYVIPAAFTRLTGGHKSASIGSVIGLFAGMLIPPVGMIFGALAGAFLAEYLIENHGVWNSFKASLGAFLGFISGTGLKLISSGLMLFYIFKFLF